MDEIGRGTSTFDGLSLAWAVARHIAEHARAFTLFATHYFELTALATELDGCANVHLDATEHGDCAGVPARGEGRPGQPQLRPAGRAAGRRAARRSSPRRAATSRSWRPAAAVGAPPRHSPGAAAAGAAAATATASIGASAPPPTRYARAWPRSIPTASRRVRALELLYELQRLALESPH